MIGHVTVQTPVAKRAALPRVKRRSGLATWQRRTLEVAVSVLAFAVWGKLAYVGGVRLLVRLQDGALGGHVLLDVASLAIGVSGAIAGVSALWAIAMRALGRTPAALVGAPDDDPVDAAYRDAHARAERVEQAPRLEPPGRP